MKERKGKELYLGILSESTGVSGEWGEQSGLEDQTFGGALCNRRSVSQGLSNVSLVFEWLLYSSSPPFL